MFGMLDASNVLVADAGVQKGGFRLIPDCIAA